MPPVHDVLVHDEAQQDAHAHHQLVARRKLSTDVRRRQLRAVQKYGARVQADGEAGDNAADHKRGVRLGSGRDAGTTLIGGP